MLLSISVLISIAFNIVFILCFGVLFHYYKKQEIKGITDGKYDIELIDRLIIERNKKNIKIKKILKIINYSLFCLLIILIVPLFIFTTFADKPTHIIISSYYFVTDTFHMPPVRSRFLHHLVESYDVAIR